MALPNGTIVTLDIPYSSIEEGEVLYPWNSMFNTVLWKGASKRYGPLIYKDSQLRVVYVSFMLV